MKNIIKYKITTKSNLFIGGSPEPFEIGGVDQYTVRDQEGFPYIPASSIKGALRTIVCENGESAEVLDTSNKLSELYSNYLTEIKKDYYKRIEKMRNENLEYNDKVDAKKESFEKKYKKLVENKNMSEYLFGIEGFNNTPKLFFSDVFLSEVSKEKSKEENNDNEYFFSIDMKNRIDIIDEKPVSNPRTYKTVRNGVTFEGTIHLHKINELGENAEDLCKKLIKCSLLKFNEGIYRLGNSKSRGYGKIEVELIDEERIGI